MNKKEIINLLVAHLEWNPDSKIIRGNEILISKNYDFHREHILFTLQINAESFNFYPDISALISYHNITDILSRYYKEYNIQYNTFTAKNKFNMDPMIQGLDIFSNNNFAHVVNEFNKLINLNIKDYFAKFKYISNLYDYINGYSNDDLHQFVRKPVMVHSILIKYFARDPEWNAYAYSVMKHYEKESKGQYSYYYLPVFKFLPSLITELERNYTKTS